MTYSFVTDTVLPIEAFTTFGINAKPNSGNPIGYFGTGLKYAVSIILRNGGKMRVLIDGTEYEFYVVNEDFRGKMFKKIRMKKRGDILGRWRYDALPFTTELGKNWELWQAYRELESNTRDENGYSGEMEPATLSDSRGKTIVEIDCNGFIETVNKSNEVFLDTGGPKVFENSKFTMYDSPSKYVYYRGVRVHDMRYPARFTYDFKAGHVELSEDRSARNTFMLFWYIAGAIMREIDSKEVLYKALRAKQDASHFEGHDLSFSSVEYGLSDAFRYVARNLSMKGFATNAIGSVYHGLITSTPSKDLMKVSLTEEQWDTALKALEHVVDNSIELDGATESAESVLNAMKEQVK